MAASFATPAQSLVHRQNLTFAFSNSNFKRTQLQFQGTLSAKSQPLSFSSQLKLPNDASPTNDHRSSFAQTAAVRHIVGSLAKAGGLRFAVVISLSCSSFFLLILEVLFVLEFGVFLKNYGVFLIVYLKNCSLVENHASR